MNQQAAGPGIRTPDLHKPDGHAGSAQRSDLARWATKTGLPITTSHVNVICHIVVNLCTNCSFFTLVNAVLLVSAVVASPSLGFQNFSGATYPQP